MTLALADLEPADPVPGFLGLIQKNVHAIAAGNALGQWGLLHRSLGRTPRLIVPHSAESLPDYVGPDHGGRSVSRYMVTVGDRRVSWPVTIDSDDVQWMLPDSAEAYHVGSTFNSWALGFETAARAGEFATAPKEWRDRILDNCAQVSAVWARRWDIPVRLITRAQAYAGESGFIPHGTDAVEGLSPGSSRSDPGWSRADWDQYLARVRHHLDAQPIALGDTGPEVEALQEKLNTMGASLTVDGDFGPLTQTEVYRAQKAQGLALTGVAFARTDETAEPDPEPTAEDLEHPPSERPPIGADLSGIPRAVWRSALLQAEQLRTTLEQLGQAEGWDR